MVDPLDKNERGQFGIDFPNSNKPNTNIMEIAGLIAKPEKTPEIIIMGSPNVLISDNVGYLSC